MDTPARPVMMVVKRAIDVLAAVLGLTILSPLLAVIVLAIRLDSPGAALFRQEREGRRGRSFRILKFRSMRQGADPTRHLVASDDGRITRVGRLLRQTSLDELPQLLNVMWGQMSLVGPRPLLPGTTSAGEMRRLEMRPGMTGLVEVNRPERLDWNARMKLDVWYVDHWSLWLDLKILARTIPIFLFRKDVVDPPRVSAPRITPGRHP